MIVWYNRLLELLASTKREPFAVSLQPYVSQKAFLLCFIAVDDVETQRNIIDVYADSLVHLNVFESIVCSALSDGIRR